VAADCGGLTAARRADRDPPFWVAKMAGYAVRKAIGRSRSALRTVAHPLFAFFLIAPARCNAAASRCGNGLRRSCIRY
jgi:hypothetical protein